MAMNSLMVILMNQTKKSDIIETESEGTIMIIACPNCGSTAQVGIVWQPNYFKDKEIPIEYRCGCGCHFVGYFKLNAVMIIGGNEDA